MRSYLNLKMQASQRTEGVANAERKPRVVAGGTARQRARRHLRSREMHHARLPRRPAPHGKQDRAVTRAHQIHTRQCSTTKRAVLSLSFASQACGYHMLRMVYTNRRTRHPPIRTYTRSSAHITKHTHSTLSRSSRRSTALSPPPTWDGRRRMRFFSAFSSRRLSAPRLIVRCGFFCRCTTEFSHAPSQMQTKLGLGHE